MATLNHSPAASNDGRETRIDAEEELRVLTALIGCIMVAEDAEGHDDKRLGVHHLAPPSVMALAKAG